MRIREAEAGEGPMVAAEFWYPLATAMESHSELNELTEDALEKARDGFESRIREDGTFVFVLETDEGTPVGFVSGERGERPTRRRGRYVSIDDIYVREEYRGRGYGTRLIERVESLAEAEGRDFVTVSTEWDNEGARRLYERCGYEAKQVSYAKCASDFD